jgi:lysophospholipase
MPMNAIVEPKGATLCLVPSNPVPQGARVGLFNTSDKVRLRYALFPRTGRVAKGTVCLLQGRTEFIEKYFETIANFQARGFAVATFDWRGQGGSERLIGKSRYGHIDRFDDYWIDLKSFHGSILLPDCPPPYYLVGHSMGGLVALLAGTRDRLMFDRMFLTTPMLALDGQPFGMGGMANLADVLAFAGLGYLPVRRRANRQMSERTFPDNPLTSSLQRYMRSVDVLRARPELETGAPTVRWIAAAMRAMASTTRDAFAGSVKIPVLMLAAAHDEVVSTAAIESLGLRMRNGRHTIIASARHELFQENDAIRAQVFAAFDAFITEQTE